MKKPHVTRRDFMKTVGVAGIGSVIATGHALAQAESGPAADGATPATAKVPRRPFGKTGANVSILALGGIFDITTNQLVLQRALDFGVTYWDTANAYTNGNSEIGIGMYFEKHPEVRKQIFLVTKAGGRHTPENLSAKLEESLRRMKTDHIDLYFIHGIRNDNALTDEIKAWAEKAKASNKIRFFGFSTHGNMENSLLAAAKAGWIDGIMLKYDYRLMQTDKMRSAVDACEKAGVGLTAMKTQGGGPIRTETEADLKLGGHFVKRGFTEHQAKLKAVWEDQRIASICSQMPSITVLSANVAASMDRTRLTAADHRALREYSEKTCTRCCDGCTDLCENALANAVPVGDVMRALMYHRSYGDLEWARNAFAEVPEAARQKMDGFDFSSAERVCPNRLPIGRLMREARETLA